MTSWWLQVVEPGHPPRVVTVDETMDVGRAGDDLPIKGFEALLDIAFIFTVHIFHANLRPDKFPMDPMFYSGRLDEHEFKVDRPLE